MIRAAEAVAVSERTYPRVWGLGPLELHERYWAARGVQVVRQGQRTPLSDAAELYLLTGPDTLVLFSLRRILDILNWLQPDLVCVRLHDRRRRRYHERVVTDAEGRFRRFERIYGGDGSRAERVALTPDRAIARWWQNAPEPRGAWAFLRRGIPRRRRATISVESSVHDGRSPQEVAQFMQRLVEVWRRPDATVRSVRRVGASAWAAAPFDGSVRCVGPVWIGAGRFPGNEGDLVGPAVLWDDPSVPAAADALIWSDIEPMPADRPVRPARTSTLGRAGKRTFDLVFAILALLLTLPLYPLIMLAIWIEDGRPFFFAHRREGLGGRPFNCVKFRSMRRDAEKIRAQLAAQNQADGPQFYIENDPRLTRVGRVLRKCFLDELPQFFNVLMGDMSVVGPRPSPREENQFCPAWREARLSVRPGITGLWQVNRTRRTGHDFQEWIKYDLEYVERFSWWLDLVIICRTVLLFVKKGILR